jgi:hypothetical protein
MFPALRECCERQLRALLCTLPAVAIQDAVRGLLEVRRAVDAPSCSCAAFCMRSVMHLLAVRGTKEVLQYIPYDRHGETVDGSQTQAADRPRGQTAHSLADAILSRRSNSRLPLLCSPLLLHLVSRVLPAVLGSLLNAWTASLLLVVFEPAEILLREAERGEGLEQAEQRGV